MRLLHRCAPLLVAIMTSSALDKASSASSTPSMAFASASVPPPAESGETTNDESGKEIPQLPEADPDSDIPSIKLGETISFEEMGPVIINSDGTTRRIENWDTLTDHEKKVTWRRISKRNEERRKALLEKMQQDEKEKEEL